MQELAWKLDLRCAELSRGRQTALLAIDPQRAFTVGSWARHFGDVALQCGSCLSTARRGLMQVEPIERCFEALAKTLAARPLTLVTRCPYAMPDFDVDERLAELALTPFILKLGMDATVCFRRWTS